MKRNIPFDVWEYCAACAKPICMYGMGNGGDKITAELEKRGLSVADYFASDGFVRGQLFHGKRVISYSDVCEKYGDPLILLAFGSDRADVMELIRKVAHEHKLLAPDVPVSGTELFDRRFFESHTYDLEEVRAMLCDEKSKRIFDRVVEYKVTGDVLLLYSEDEGLDSVFAGLLNPAHYRYAADLGAYTGDTVRELLPLAENIEKLYALEPDRRTFKKLSDYVENDNLGGKVIAIPAAAGEIDGEAKFSAEGNRNSSVSDNGKDSVTVRCVDSLCPEPLDYIKFDVEGAEEEAILGAKRQITENKPDLRVSVYHRSRDIFSLPKLIHTLCPEYRFYLRRERCIPAWDVELIATVRY